MNEIKHHRITSQSTCRFSLPEVKMMRSLRNEYWHNTAGGFKNAATGPRIQETITTQKHALIQRDKVLVISLMLN